ncbi:hypothetical protein Pmani_023283 [Petrolisthes manimaculis]|uniref:Uncharacterized protein n=1 Tax=Petrolisthes manimaculis TaxID=1843537 RepID=A0AAE1PC50_9EUCA|nr:hypothetical protein Pmani_023283 [Petrolisthes manimaculis]
MLMSWSLFLCVMLGCVVVISLLVICLCFNKQKEENVEELWLTRSEQQDVSNVWTISDTLNNMAYDDHQDDPVKQRRLSTFLPTPPPSPSCTTRDVESAQGQGHTHHEASSTFPSPGKHQSHSSCLQKFTVVGDAPVMSSVGVMGFDLPPVLPHHTPRPKFPGNTPSPRRDLTATSPALSTVLGNIIKGGFSGQALSVVRATLRPTQGHEGVTRF